jgi:hypothetical protein
MRIGLAGARTGAMRISKIEIEGLRRAYEGAEASLPCVTVLSIRTNVASQEPGPSWPAPTERRTELVRPIVRV